MKPQFKQNRGQPLKYKFPKEKGDVLAVPFKNKKKLVSIRMSAYQYGKRHGLKFRTWTDGKDIIVECL